MARLPSSRHWPRALLLVLALLAGCVRRPAPPPPVTGSVAPPALRATMLRAHAAARAQVGLPPLVWNEALAVDAQHWAAMLARTGGFRHASQAQEGENLWMGTRGYYRYDQMVGAWVDERRAFTGPATPFLGRGGVDVGHYSQIVWRRTTALGCAIASNPRDDVLVCRYWPMGNIIGERAY